MKVRQTWRRRSIGTVLTTLSASALVLSGAVLAVSASAASSATQLIIHTPPPSTATSGVALTTQPVIYIADSTGTAVTGLSSPVTATITGQGSTQLTNYTATAVNGVATFSGLTLNTLVGNYTLTFSDATDAVPSVTSSSIAVAAGTASKLAVTTQPALGEVTGVPLVTQPVVKVEDAGANVVASASGSVTATSSCPLTGTTTETLASGVATFTNLSMTGPTNTSCTITFADSPLTSAVSNAVLMSGPASQLVIATQPSNTATSGVALATQPVVLIEDAAGTQVKADTSTVSASVTTGSGTFTNGTAVAVAGRATFSGLALSARAGVYTLTFSDGTLSVTISTSVTVNVGTANHLVVTTEPSTVAQSGVALAIVPVISVLDAGGNVVTSVNSGLASVSIVSGTGGAISAGATAPFVSGVATFNGLAITGTSGMTYGLAYSGGGFSVVDTGHVTLGVAQSPLVVTSTHAIFGRNLRLVTSGGSGTSAVTYVAANGTASGCRLNGAVLFYSSTGTCIVTATKAASGLYQSATSTPTYVQIVKLPIPPALNAYFNVNSSALTPRTRHDLILLARKLTPASRVRILAYAPHNMGLARARSHAVWNFLHVRVHSHYQLMNQTNTRLQFVHVATLSQ